MSYYTPKKTFKQKAKKFFVKLGLVAAFAAAVGGTGYNYYGTREDVTVKVTSVENVPQKDANDAPKQIVHTDHGTFENSVTRMYTKDASDVNAIGGLLTPGATVKLTVYGLDPHLGKLSRESIHFYRNIIKAHQLSAGDYASPPQGEQTPPPLPGAGQPIDPNSQILTPPQAGVQEDQTLPEASASNSNLAEISQKTPQIARDLASMKQLPITGQALYDMLKDPANGIQTTLFPVPKGEGSTSSYQNKQVRVARGSGAHTSFHEYFHSWQDHNAIGQPTMFNLTMKDAIVSNLLKEASAVAFEMSSSREALNHGIPYAAPNVYKETLANGAEVTLFTTSPSQDPANIKVFNDAYDKAWAANSSLDAQTREAKSLEAGGKAVVYRLLDGQDGSWRFTYVQVAVANINNNLHAFKADENAKGYAQKRDGVYQREGGLSNKINFIPDEYLGPNAAKQIDKTFNGLGFSIEKTSSITPAPSQDNTKMAENAPLPKAPKPAFG